MRKEIEEAEGQEVLFVGQTGDEGLVSSIVTAARGSDTSVPALMPFMEKGDVVLHNHPSGVLKPSAADLSVASYLGNQGIGFFLVDNKVHRIYAVSEPVKKKSGSLLPAEECASILEPSGSMSRVFSGYEARESQIEMLKTICFLFNKNRIGLLEAGTGVGKSLAYLIPSALWAYGNDERVVVSTATINLQQQLMDKDIPLVMKLLRKDVPYILIKGRGNYLCLRRLEETLEEEGLFTETDSDLVSLRSWASVTETGDKSELTFYPDPSLWSRVCSESDGCMGLHCRYRERCFILLLRRNAAGAKLLVVNHHLLFSDLSARLHGAGFESAAVLPPFSRLVFDEAHNLEHSATSFFSETLASAFIAKQISRLYRQKKGKTLGLALTLQRMAGENDIFREIPKSVSDLSAQAKLLDEQTCGILGSKMTFRITDREEQFMQEVSPLLTELRDRINRLISFIKDALDLLNEEDQESPAAFETKTLLARLSGQAALCGYFLEREEHPDKVFWIETVRRSGNDPMARYIISPLHIGEMMAEAVYEPMKTLVCTSATLSIKEDFSYLRNKIGLTSAWDERTDSVIFPSPFAYKERVFLGIPSDAPNPADAAYVPYIIDFIKKALEVSEGRALILFTSYSMLKSVYEEAAPFLRDLGILALKQGDNDRARLLDQFRGDIKSVLFATDSFWAGVDTPGESLSLVIICRLPFQVPTDPVLMARMEEIEKRGGNSFFELSLPDAVIKLKQGFGRLMRCSSDRGAVLILDPRIINKPYGGFFLKSLPETIRSVKESERLLSDLENFLYGG